MEPEKINHPYLTAIRQTTLSAPTRYLLQHGMLKGRILDFGCGFGFDADELKRQGYDIAGYDYYYRPKYPEGKFDTILCNYVLNVLEPYAQAEVMMNVTNLLHPYGTAFFAVQRDLKEEGFRLHAIHRQYTYQCNVHLPFLSLECNADYELYQYNHFNKLPRKENETCPFCRLSRRMEIICETATCVAFYDGYPVSPGHALIIPKRHVASYFDLTNHEREAMNVMLQYVKQKVDERYYPDGYNVGIDVNEAAGQSVFHVHMHLIPRYKGDVENPKGGVRGVIPEKQKYSTIKDKLKISPSVKKQKTYTLEEKREEHGNAYLPWDDTADKLLCRMYNEGKSVGVLAEIFERTEGAIRSRLKKLGKIE
ncbi:bifunctional class I SAM-dependent methyltransferase/HIT family protein [Paraprevotella sp.]|jgi:diadenosine tetraphosphate (Ap4A) HIT family hydrolase|uniref:HIT family protein n=1 Tax=Paraprevotella sp. TaxID=2049036 RepID=UPI00257BA495|nr:bifunctional class I SAM-dependent methyltransferase/HIT family protein [Paraprevotella sp.]